MTFDLVAAAPRQAALAYDPELSVPDLFAQAMALDPDAIAVIEGARAATYADLDRMSDGVAQFVVEQGARRGDFVGFWSARSIETVAVMLGVMKAGACFVPFDPAYPAGQLSFMIDDCKPKVLLAQRALLDAGSAFAPPAELTFVLEDVVARRASFVGPLEKPTGSDRAYAMYTSGSTGTPKGVVALHRGIARLVREQEHWASFDSSTRFLHASPLAFDASTLELWAPLCNGGSLVVAPDHQPSLSDIAERMIRHGVNAAWLTSGLFNLMVEHRIDALKALSLLLTGGDVLSPVHVEKALVELPHCRIVNGYGPTENTTFTCCYVIPRTWRGATVPIGAPLNHTTVRILDPETRAPVASQELGALWTGGDGVAEGYLNRPDLNEKVFAVFPDGERLYNTGDLARMRADGVIEFHGRNDRQVKISGRRIELDEIEIALRRDEENADAAVICELAASGQKAIYAFVKPNDPAVLADPEPYIARLIARLSTKLPKFMVPARIVALETLPLSTSGKLDRQSLRAHLDATKSAATEPSPSAADTRGGQDASDLARQIAGVWRETLALPQVGYDQNFFDLGGSSLLMTSAHARIEALVGRALPIVLLFEHPTIRGVAAAISGSGDTNDTAAASKARANRQRDALARMKPKGQ